MADPGNLRRAEGPGVQERFSAPGGKLLFLVVIFLVAAGSTLALDNDPILSGEFWVELDPFVETANGGQLSHEEAHMRILEEARFVFSGMIYGFKFVYTPSDATRKVDERFTFEAVAQIPWGDPALTVVDTRLDGNVLRAHVRYVPSGHQLRWIEMMQSNIYHDATGWGQASMFGGAKAKYDAIAEAAKEAIRAHLRPRIFNKPKEVRGSVAFTEAPYVIIDAGEYRAKVSVRIDVDEIVPYRLY